MYLCPVNQNPHFISARKLFSQGDYSGSIIEYSEAIAIEESPNFFSERAVAFIHEKKYEEALTDFNKAIELEPNYGYRYSSRAYLHDAMGNLELAIEDYNKAILLDPADAVAYNNLGLLEEKLGYKNKARKNFAEADRLSKEMGIDLGSPVNIQKEIDKNQENKNESYQNTIKSVFVSKESRKEFFRFIKNGFKINKP